MQKDIEKKMLENNKGKMGSFFLIVNGVRASGLVRNLPTDRYMDFFFLGQITKSLFARPTVLPASISTCVIRRPRYRNLKP